MELKFRRNEDYQDLRAEMTPEPMFMDRRRVLAAAGVIGGTSLLGALPACSEPQQTPATAGAGGYAFAGQALTAKASAYAVADKQADERAFTDYCNYYEFGPNKNEPAKNAGKMDVSKWSVTVEGETDAPGTYNLKDLIDYSNLEERVYRHRCVERWSMVVPWVGVPLSSIVTKLKPKATAKYVQFLTHLDPKVMVGLNRSGLDWPYSEGLRLDEAKNELAFIAVGAYGKALLQQNGAPIRTVLPWKYGYKGTKSIARIRFVATQPKTAWNEMQPSEYGFYSNVNPNRAHPRWSQEMEQVLGVGGFNPQRKTEMFNGYEKQVASLYAGMDLIKNH